MFISAVKGTQIENTFVSKHKNFSVRLSLRVNRLIYLDIVIS